VDRAAGRPGFDKMTLTEFTEAVQEESQNIASISPTQQKQPGLQGFGKAGPINPPDMASADARAYEWGAQSSGEELQKKVDTLEKKLAILWDVFSMASKNSKGEPHGKDEDGKDEEV
jgi:hypothetical protein